MSSIRAYEYIVANVRNTGGYIKLYNLQFCVTTCIAYISYNEFMSPRRTTHRKYFVYYIIEVQKPYSHICTLLP